MTPATPSLKIALAGNPNSGKSSVFNRLTGLRQKVGNFPGVTVDKKTGSARLKNGRELKIVDLPGIYSLYPRSPDEAVSLKILVNREDRLYPDAVVYVADAGCLERHLLLFSQIMDLGIPCILALNMIDLAIKEGYSCDSAKLAKKLGVPVIEINGRTGMGLDQLESILESLSDKQVSDLALPRSFSDVRSLAPEVIDEVRSNLHLNSDYRALLIAHHYDLLPHLSSEQKQTVAGSRKEHGFKGLHMQVEETLSRYDKIRPLVQSVIRRVGNRNVLGQTERADRILTHPLWGSIIFAALLVIIFQAMFAWASLPMEWIDQGVSIFRQSLANVLPSSIITDLMVDGIIPGIGGILIFIPQIAILFALITLLEEIGYMARAVYLSDSIMRRFGLNGRSFVALISGVACAVPAIMTTRGITNWKERLTTILVTPFMSCSARLPVYAILIAFAVPQKSYLGGMFNLQGLVILGLYLLGALTALFSAYVLKKIFKSTDPSLLMLELPTYKAPHWKHVGLTVIEKVKVFVFNAGKIILLISVVLWALSSYGPGRAVTEAEEKTRSQYAQSDLSAEQIENRVAARKLEASWAGHMGKAIEPAIKPLGFDWKIGIALVTSFAAREVFVSTMATIYSAGSSSDKETLNVYMKKDVDLDTGAPVYSVATAFSLLLFYAFAMQCMSTLAVVRRETKSWSIPLYQFLFMTGLAYLASLLVYQLMT